MHSLFVKLFDDKLINPFSFAAGSYQVKRVSSTDKELFFRGQHASMINGLQHRYPIYGPVVRSAFARTHEKSSGVDP